MLYAYSNTKLHTVLRTRSHKDSEISNLSFTEFDQIHTETKRNTELKLNQLPDLSKPSMNPPGRFSGK